MKNELTKLKLISGKSLTSRISLIVQFFLTKLHICIMLSKARSLNMFEVRKCFIHGHSTPLSFTPIFEKVCVIGGGSFGTTIGRIIATNIASSYSNGKQGGVWVHNIVNLWTHKEYIFDTKSDSQQPVELSELINRDHKNPKYLPNIILPANLVASCDLEEAVKDATMIVFAVPQQYMPKVCEQLRGKVAPHARALSLVKGIMKVQNSSHPHHNSRMAIVGGHSHLSLVSDHIKSTLGMDVSVLMGANIAQGLATEHFSEATIGGKHTQNAMTWKSLLETQYFRLSVIQDAIGAELCGALKNIVATAAGLVDGLYFPGGHSNHNAKAAILRRGLIEMRDISHLLNESVHQDTIMENCGISDVIASSYGGRNRLVAEMLVHAAGLKTLHDIEVHLLNGQILEGPATSAIIYEWIHSRKLEPHFPIMTAVYRVCFEGAAAQTELFRERRI